MVNKASQFRPMCNWHSMGAVHVRRDLGNALRGNSHHGVTQDVGSHVLRSKVDPEESDLICELTKLLYRCSSGPSLELFDPLLRDVGFNGVSHVGSNATKSPSLATDHSGCIHAEQMPGRYSDVIVRQLTACCDVVKLFLEDAVPPVVDRA